MKRGIPITTANTKIGYAVETLAGTMPKTAALIPDIKTMPALNSQPEMLDTSDLSCEKSMTFTPALVNLSQASTYTANFTALLKKEWAKLVAASEAAEASELATWFFIQLRNGCTVAYTGKPSAMGAPGGGTNTVLEIELYIAPTNEPQWIDDTITFTEPTNDD